MASSAASKLLSTSPTPLSNVGKVFFGSLCVGTFTLGVWQCQRLIDKQSLQKQRLIDIHQDPIVYTDYSNSNQTTVKNNDDNNITESFRRILIKGKYDHDHEILIGPRGPPQGALPDKPGSSAQGMASAPQGYYIITPMYLNNSSIKDNNRILVNRGWVPRNMVIDENNKISSHRRGNRGVDGQQKQLQQEQQLLQWDRPLDDVEVVVVPAKLEKPKFLVAEHNFQSKPPRLYWFDLPSMLACANMPFVDTNNNLGSSSSLPILVTQVQHQNQKDDIERTMSWPVCPSVDKVGEFKITPAVHAGYAFTWFSLSAAGLYMTRKLITKGR